MNSDWTKVRLNELADITMGQSPSSEHYNLEGIGLPFFQGCSDFGELYPSERKYCSKPTRIAKRGDVLMSVRAPVGDLNIANKECCIGRGVCSIRSKTGDRFVYYLLKVNLRLIQSYSGGTTYQSINKKEVNELPLFVPTLIIQQKIASILSAYDNLIENNTRRIQILEEMAQRIYKEWFVDFKYPGYENDKLVDSELGMIPEGWEARCVSEYYDVRSGYAFKSKDMVEFGDYGIVKIKNIQSDGLKLDPIQYISEELIQDRAYNFELIENDLLIAMTGAQVGKVGLMPKSKDRFLLNQRVGKFFPKAEFETNNMFMYQLSKSNIFQISVVNIAQGAAQPNISGTQIGSIQFPGPPSELILRFEKLCESIKDEVLVLNFKNQKLNQTRDLLLPKLISGKIDVSDLDIDTSILND